jgi:serine/threonine protein kinase
LPELRADAVALLRDEARAMAGLNHEHLAVIYGLEVWRDTPVLIVEFLEGGTLREKIRRGPLPLHDVVAIGCRLADALTYMHERKVLHRDIKPSNIGFTATGRVKLLDFGLAPSQRLGGTPAYLPPEVAQPTSPSVAFDLWALSVVLREMVSEKKRREMRPAVAAFFERALAVEPERRFRSARELRAALEHLRDA